MRRALESLRRSVDEDGSPDSEYAVALALALVRRPHGRVHGVSGSPDVVMRLGRY